MWQSRITAASLVRKQHSGSLYNEAAVTLETTSDARIFRPRLDSLRF